MNRIFQTLLHSNVAPRVIDPQTHKTLDLLVTSFYLVIAGAFWGTHRRAATTAIMNAVAVAGATAMTDYDGTGRRPLSFETHGKLDIAQAAMASSMPILMGFGGEWPSMIFQGQALSEIAVVGATDWEANEPVGGSGEIAA